MDEIGLQEARATLGEIVDRARLAERPTLITRQGKPAAVVVSERAFTAAVEHIRYARNDGDPRNGLTFLKELVEQCERYDAIHPEARKDEDR